jgi:hypothetical protein
MPTGQVTCTQRTNFLFGEKVPRFAMKRGQRCLMLSSPAHQRVSADWRLRVKALGGRRSIMRQLRLLESTNLVQKPGFPWNEIDLTTNALGGLVGLNPHAAFVSQIGALIVDLRNCSLLAA